MAAKQRAAAKALAKVEETLNRVQEHLDNADDEPQKRGPGRPPQVEAARHEHQRLAGQRETVTQSIRAIGYAYHLVDLERGVRRNGKLIASDIQHHIDTIRTIAQQEGLSETCLDRIEKAARVVPKMQATIEFVSGYVRQQVRQLDLAPPTSYAMHAHLIPSFSLDRVASTRTVTQGEPLRELAAHIRTPLFEPGGALRELNPLEQNQLKATRPGWRRCSNAPAPMSKGATGTSRSGTINYEDWTTPESVRA
jgi:hypothetical protein